jgi:hypothetical protein
MTDSIDAYPPVPNPAPPRIPFRSRNRSRLALVATLTLGLIPAVCAAQQPSAAPQYDEWKLVTQSDLILKARLTVPVDAIREAMRTGNHSYLTFRATVTGVLKGLPTLPTVHVRVYTAPAAYAPSPQAVINRHQKDALLFLVRSDDPAVAGLHFAGSTPKALDTIDPKVIKAVLAEVQNQRRILNTFQASRTAQPDTYHQTVKALIEKMLHERTEAAAFQKLEQMGQAAVPSMIRLMDDRRLLPIPQISLENRSPNAFEGIAHYGPKLVVDAMAVLLEAMSGESFGTIANGGSERERAATVDSWRIYLYYQQGKRE